MCYGNQTYNTLTDAMSKFSHVSMIHSCKHTQGRYMRHVIYVKHNIRKLRKLKGFVKKNETTIDKLIVYYFCSSIYVQNQLFCQLLP